MMAAFGHLVLLPLLLRFNIYLGKWAIIIFNYNNVTTSEVDSLIQILKAECKGISIRRLDAIGVPLLSLRNFVCEKEDIIKHLDDRMTLFWRVGDNMDELLATLTKLNDQQSKFRM